MNFPQITKIQSKYNQEEETNPFGVFLIVIILLISIGFFIEALIS